MMAMDSEWLKGLLEAWAQVMHKHKDELIALDGLCGDSDLGLTMSEGFQAASVMVAGLDETDLGKLLYQAGKAMAGAVPSTMGTLMASGLMEAGKVLKGRQTLDAAGLVSLYQAYYEGVFKRGKANRGEKTFLDGLGPAVDSLEVSAQRGADMAEMAKLAAVAARQGYQNTQGMLARHGRMAIRGELSKDYLDPGAAVAALMIETWANYTIGGD
jgi:dihydroxyacetone kinase-like protein